MRTLFYGILTVAGAILTIKIIAIIILIVTLGPLLILH